MKHLFIINPAAGKVDFAKSLAEILDGYKDRMDYEIYHTQAPGDATAYIRDYCRKYTDPVRFYACGGDGTINEVVNGAVGFPHASVGCYPCGSGNDFVKSLGVPAECFLDLQALIKGDAVDVDLLLAKDADNVERVSLNIISAGFDAAVCKGQERVKKLPLVSGKSAYNISLVKSVFTKTKHYFVLKVDGQRFGDSAGPYLFAIAANGKYYGGGFKASPFSDLNDGLLDLIRIDTVSRPRFLSLVGKFRKGEYIHEYEDIVNYTQCRKMQIVAEKEVDINLDGEIYPMNNPIVEIIPKAMKLILPKED